MGSATANVEAALLGRNSIGVDIDPFSKLLSRVKTTPLDQDDLLKSHQYLRCRCERFTPESVRNGIPTFPHHDEWFWLEKPSFIQGWC